jgi:hypothetical protein
MERSSKANRDRANNTNARRAMVPPLEKRGGVYEKF